MRTRVDFSGPFFERDPQKTIRDNIGDLMDALALEAERDVVGQIQSKAGAMPRYTGWTASHVRGRTSSIAGKRWALNMVVSMDTRGMGAQRAIRTQAAAASIERRWHPFRRTASAVRRSRAVIYANLTEGLE